MNEENICVLEQFSEVATVTNNDGVTEELFILHPPQSFGEISVTSATPLELSVKTDKEAIKKKTMKTAIKGPKHFPSTALRHIGAPATKEVMQSTLRNSLPIIPKLDVLQPHVTAVMKIGPSEEKRNLPKVVHDMYKKNYVGFPCHECKRVFTVKGNLKVHMKVHSCEKSFRCVSGGCKKAFKDKNQLSKHETAHKGITQWTCKLCSIGFSSKNALLEHEAIHSNSKPHKCMKCGQVFRQYSCLSRHYMVHSEEMRFSCQICDKKFKSKTYLQSHMKVHSGATPYKCQVCGKGYKHQSDLNRHSNIHSKKKPYMCSICDQVFHDVSQKNRHERMHKDENRFECRLCSEKFKIKYDLKAHMVQYHTAKGEVTVNDTAMLFHQSVNQANVIPFIKSSPAEEEMNEEETVNDDSDEKTPAISSPSKEKKPLSEPPTTETSLHRTDGTATKSHMIKKKFRVEKRMVTHQVAVPKVNGKAVSVDPLALLDHIKDQLDPSQLPQTIDGKPVQLSCKVIKQSRDQQVMELQYLSTVLVRRTKSELEEALSHLNALKHESAADIHGTDVPEPTANNTQVLHQSELPVTTTDLTQVSDARLLEDFEAKEESSQFSNKDETDVEMKDDNSNNDSLDFLTSEITKQFVKKPDFTNQDYFNWLSAFSDACQSLTLPLDPSVYLNISNVNKKLTDMMGNPTGVLANKRNFIISRSISQDLSKIMDEHLSFVQNALDP